jgi:hypothetical protein
MAHGLIYGGFITLEISYLWWLTLHLCCLPILAQRQSQSELLYLAGFCDPPYKLKGEKSVEFTVEERDETYRGRIDALVLKNQFWLTLIESKQTKLSFSFAIPQALAYMMANPHPTQPSFGLVTNGDNFLFLKLIQEPVGYYDLSTDFSIFARPHNELYNVLQIMKRIGTLIT